MFKTYLCTCDTGTVHVHTYHTVYEGPTWHFEDSEFCLSFGCGTWGLDICLKCNSLSLYVYMYIHTLIMGFGL